MKLKRLELKAFGPFTDRILEFDAAGPGLHIIYGPNEAGKSSSLRAIETLLYGFDQRTPDDFVHSYDQLLVGGCLESSKGRKISFYRRKKRIGDIVDSDGNPLDSSVLSPFIQGVGPEIYRSLYGIDHDALVQGGEDILDQKGEVGQALFAAGAGISSLRAVIDQLDREAAELFKPRGQKLLINLAIKRFKELRKAVKAASLSVKEWKGHRKTLNSAEKDRQTLEKRRDQKNREMYRLERLKQAVPELAALRSRQDQLMAMGEVVQLSQGFSKSYQQVSREIREAKLQLVRDRDRLKKLVEKREAIFFNDDILRQADHVDDFHQRLGEYRKGQKDRPQINGRRIGLRTEAARLLQQVRPDLTLENVERLRPVLSKKRSVQSLSPRYEVIQQQLTQAMKQVKTAEQEHRAATEKLAEMPEIKISKGLVQAVKLAQKVGRIDEQLEKRRYDVARTRESCEREIRRTGVWSGDLDALLALSLPLPETVQRFDFDHGRMVEEKIRLEKECRNNEKELKATQTDIKKMTYSGDVPTEGALMRIREKREQGWTLLRRQWIEQEDVAEEIRRYAPDQSLDKVYEENVGKADHIADRLRREADRVARATALGAKIEALKAGVTENEDDLKRLGRQIQEHDSAWSDLWKSAGIDPLTPKEMSGWLNRMDTLRFKVEEMFIKDQEIQADLQNRKALRRAIEKELLSVGEPDVPGGKALGPALVFAETVLERAEKLKGDVKTLEERRQLSESALRQAEKDIEGAQQSLGQWREKWKKALSGLGLQHEVAPDEALDHLENLQGCFEKLHQAEEFQKRMDGIDRDAAALTEEVSAFVQKAAPDLFSMSVASMPVDQVIPKLRTMLSEAQKYSRLIEEISEEIDSVQSDITVGQKTLERADERMAELLRTAKCEKPEDLVTVIDRFDHYQRLHEKISDTEAALAKIGAGVSVEELSSQAELVSADDLPGMIAALRQDIEEGINPEINRISQVIGEENNKLATMDGSAQAADAAEKMEQELAAMRRYAERYIILKLASNTLQMEIERYRETHQDPVLKIASGYFEALTTGSFAGLRTDVNDKGNPILVGQRPDNTRLTVEKMSSGTRDQLYLSLRLASVAWRLETSEPMPFIVDDILINFDDHRSKATLAVLADLSEKNQVILFTHHHQVVEAADRLDGKSNVQIHSLQ